jgi:hypothetical protein
VNDDLYTKIVELEKKLGKNWIENFMVVTSSKEIQMKAEKSGVTLSVKIAEELRKYIEKTRKGELTDKELGSIAGGQGKKPDGFVDVVCSSDDYNF